MYCGFFQLCIYYDSFNHKESSKWQRTKSSEKYRKNEIFTLKEDRSAMKTHEFIDLYHTKLEEKSKFSDLEFLTSSIQINTM